MWILSLIIVTLSFDANTLTRTFSLINTLYIQTIYTEWLVYCLLAGPDLWKRIPLKYSITMVFTCHLLTLRKIASPFRENNNVVVFLFPFHIFMPLANLWFIQQQTGKKSPERLYIHSKKLFSKIWYNWLLTSDKSLSWLKAPYIL